jgi:hypothetical protein
MFRSEAPEGETLPKPWREQCVELRSFPAAHDEAIVADTFVALPDQFVPFRDQQLTVLGIKGGDTRKYQLASVGRDSLF